MMCLLVSELLSRADSLSEKFEQGGDSRYIDEAIALDREALDLCTHGHPRRFDCLFGLACHLGERYDRLGGVEGLNEAVLRGREALALRPSGNPGRAGSLGNLAGALWT